MKRIKFALLAILFALLCAGCSEYRAEIQADNVQWGVFYRTAGGPMQLSGIVDQSFQLDSDDPTFSITRHDAPPARLRARIVKHRPWPLPDQETGWVTLENDGDKAGVSW